MEAQQQQGGESKAALVIGLDLGTGGARAVVVSADGEVVSRGAATIAGAGATSERHEQQPSAWWNAAREALGEALQSLSGQQRAALRALSVDGTSGTIVGLDAEGCPVTPALMYNDSRASEEAAQLTRSSGGLAIASSFSIAKIAWIERQLPSAFAATEIFAHQADYVAGKLSGVRGVSDWSNALKTGYDPEAREWPEWLFAVSGVRAKLPRVVAPGETIGSVDQDVARELGLPPTLKIVAGCTDGTAGFLASGAAEPGDDNTTLGTTLVFKRVSESKLKRAGSALYCHALPGGLWLPGAASNVGGDWIRQEFAGADPEQLDARVQLPSPHLAYPSMVIGERFPFDSASATGFCDAPEDDELARYAAKLQGTAFVERLAYEVLDAATPGLRRGAVYATGGASRSDVWMQLRADACGRVMHRPACSESAFGSALLAAAGAGLWPDLRSACRHMQRIESTFRPDPERARSYEPLYQRFKAELEGRGYL